MCTESRCIRSQVLPPYDVDKLLDQRQGHKSRVQISCMSCTVPFLYKLLRGTLFYKADRRSPCFFADNKNRKQCNGHAIEKRALRLVCESHSRCTLYSIYISSRISESKLLSAEGSLGDTLCRIARRASLSSLLRAVDKLDKRDTWRTASLLEPLAGVHVRCSYRDNDVRRLNTSPS